MTCISSLFHTGFITGTDACQGVFAIQRAGELAKTWNAPLHPAQMGLTKAIDHISHFFATGARSSDTLPSSTQQCGGQNEHGNFACGRAERRTGCSTATAPTRSTGIPSHLGGRVRPRAWSLGRCVARQTHRSEGGRNERGPENSGARLHSCAGGCDRVPWGIIAHTVPGKRCLREVDIMTCVQRSGRERHGSRTHTLQMVRTGGLRVIQFTPHWQIWMSHVKAHPGRHECAEQWSSILCDTSFPPKLGVAKWQLGTHQHAHAGAGPDGECETNGERASSTNIGFQKH